MRAPLPSGPSCRRSPVVGGAGLPRWARRARIASLAWRDREPKASCLPRT